MEPNTFAIDLLDAAVDEDGAAVASTSASAPARSVDGRLGEVPNGRSLEPQFAKPEFD